MTKADLIKEISSRTGIDKIEVKKVVELSMKVISSTLGSGESVYLRTFGTFTTKNRKAKIGRIIKTGETVQIPAHKIPFFKPSKELSNKVDKLK